jgi:hypothetical protein
MSLIYEMPQVHTTYRAHVCNVHVSGLYSSSTPGVFYTYFYNHARRLRLEKLLYI